MFDPELVGEYIDSIADELLQFGDLIQSSGPTSPQKLAQFVAQEADLKSGQHILDAGCGTGFFDILLLQHIGPAKIEGIDISKKLIKRGQHLISVSGVPQNQLNLKQGDFNKLSSIYPQNTFDRVLFLDSILYTPDYDTTLKEAKRVLKPDGKIYIKTTFPIYHPPGTEQHEILTEYKNIFLETNFLNYIFYHDFVKLLESNYFLCEKSNIIKPYDADEKKAGISQLFFNNIRPEFLGKVMKLLIKIHTTDPSTGDLTDYNYNDQDISFLAYNATPANVVIDDAEFTQ